VKDRQRRHGSPRRRTRAAGATRDAVEWRLGGALCWSLWLPFML
jgi:hypothetical protein